MLIYKITNKVNNKVYIGQTVKTVEARWKEHQRHAIKQYPHDKDKHLYRAMRKYGLSNFSCEVIQDDIDNFDQLDKAEIYWIDFYQSFLFGYNETLGGQQRHNNKLPNELIIKDYMKTKSARKTAKNFGIDHSTVDAILNHNNVKRFSYRESVGKSIKIIKGDFEKVFNSVIEYAEWFAIQPFCKTNKSESVRTSLKNAKKKNKRYYGFDVIELNKE